VKADRQKRPTWFVRKRPDVNASQFWFFLSVPRLPTELPDTDAVEMFILSVEECRTLWDSSDWNQKNPGNGDLRRWQIPDTALSAWRKLPA
jgi:hypothetical protein